MLRLPPLLTFLALVALLVALATPSAALHSPGAEAEAALAGGGSGPSGGKGSGLRDSRLRFRDDGTFRILQVGKVPVCTKSERGVP